MKTSRGFDLIFKKESTLSVEIYQSFKASGWPKWFCSAILFQAFIIVFNET